MGHPSHPEVLACGLPAPRAPEALPTPCPPCPQTAHRPPAASSVPHVGSTLGLPTQIFLFPWTKVVIGLKKEREKEKEMK